MDVVVVRYKNFWIRFGMTTDPSRHQNNQSGDLTLTPAENSPSLDNKHPMAGFPQVCFIKNTVSNPIFGNGWDKVMPKSGDLPYKGDTIIGNDVWIGYEALIMRGVKIGNGAIISSRSVVVSDVPAYTVVGGNPAKAIRQRFEPNEIATLEKIAWWDWPVQKITDNLNLIVAGDVSALEAIS